MYKWLGYLRVLGYSDKGVHHACVHTSTVLGWSQYFGTFDLVCYNPYTFLRISMPFDGVTGHPSRYYGDSYQDFVGYILSYCIDKHNMTTSELLQIH